MHTNHPNPAVIPYNSGEACGLRNPSGVRTFAKLLGDLWCLLSFVLSCRRGPFRVRDRLYEVLKQFGDFGVGLRV